MARSLRKGKINESRRSIREEEDKFDPKELGLEEEESQDPDELNKMLGLPSGDAPLAEGDEDEMACEEESEEKKLEENENGEEKLEEEEDELHEEEGDADDALVGKLEKQLGEEDGDANDALVGKLEKQLGEEDEEELKVEGEEEEEPMAEESDEEILKKLDEEDEPKKDDEELHETINKIFAGQNLTKEFKRRVTAIFEATVNAKAKKIREGVKRSALSILKEQRLRNREYMINVLDRYTKHAARSWFSENRIPVVDKITVELSEGAIKTIKGYLSQFNVRVPRSRENLVEKLSAANRTLTEKCDRVLKENMKLQEQLGKIVKRDYIKRIAEGLSDTDREKFVRLAEEVSFTDAKSYRIKLQSIREGLFSSAEKGAEDFSAKMLMKEENSDKGKPVAVSDGSQMARYLAALEGDRS